MPEAIIEFDGGARPNPGPAAIGYILRTNELTERNSKQIGESTNNKAEYYALIHGLKLALDHKATTVLAKGDSQLIVNQVRGEWGVNEESLRPLYDQTQKLADKFDQFAIEHIPREQNQEADSLVDEAFSE